MCPEAVRRRYFLGDVMPPGIAAKIGTGVHEGAEVNHLAKIVTGKDEPLDVIQDAARDAYIRSIENYGIFFPIEERSTANIQMSEGVDITTDLAGVYHKSLAPLIMPEFVEKRFEMDVDGIDLPFTGTIDLLTTDNWLADLKTAARKWPQSKADNSIQCTIYREAVKRETGKPPDKMSFEVFTKTKKREHHSIVTTRTDEDFEFVVSRAKLMLQSIKAGIFQPCDPDSWNCNPKWCGYYWTCPHIPAHKKILPKGA